MRATGRVADAAIYSARSDGGVAAPSTANPHGWPRQRAETPRILTRMGWPRSGRGPRGYDSMDYLPMFVDVRGRACLVVGGGDVALRKVELLHDAGARVRIVAPRACAPLRGLARGAA